MKANTTGEFNTAIGWQSMEFNDQGIGNVAVGINTLKNNFTGIRNVAVGNNNLRACLLTSVRKEMSCSTPLGTGVHQ